ncbi:nickel pincer cofactor biosynthesis protein LarC [Salsuginibacillus kocurii]|uniref:nickel pincer cofactor biosynthesis protein LarC n=1 Tax=Salsuginibacillus kocurii TaxID=427078 RepID=UPI0003810B22|nr:nickel pincer cofactor biosynthesis protein LarC [Salsuginibacillus kocurii]
MNTLYLDATYGISGDMTLGALIDAGADLEYITSHLEQLPLEWFSLHVSSTIKTGISAKQLDVDIKEEKHEARKKEHNAWRHHHHRHAADILHMISASSLPERVKERSEAVFAAIAEAEGKIHGISPEEVHFHEVGALDSIIDVIGVALALESLNIEHIICSAIPTGSGKIQIDHGLYPVPAPATLELLKGIPISPLEVTTEVTTPTGAAFAKVLAEQYGAIPALTLERVGYGAGKKEFENHPNILRALILSSESQPGTEEIEVLECHFDDISGEELGYVMERLLALGVLDAYYSPIYMKKNRPGTLLTVLTPPSRVYEIETVLFQETTTFGIRKSKKHRRILDRTYEEVQTPYGNIRVKIGSEDGVIYQQSPEYEDMKRLAQTHNVSVRTIFDSVTAVLYKHKI